MFEGEVVVAKPFEKVVTELAVSEQEIRQARGIERIYG